MSWGQHSQHTWCDGCWGRAGVWLGTGSPSPAQRGPSETIGVSGTGMGQEESGLPCQRAFLWMFLLCWFGTRPAPAQLWHSWLSGPAALSPWQLSAPCAPLAASSTEITPVCLAGSTQSLPSAALLAKLVSICSKLSKQGWWRSRTKQGRRCCRPGLDLRDSRSRLDSGGKLLCAAAPSGVELTSWPWFFPA